MRLFSLFTALTLGLSLSLTAAAAGSATDPPVGQRTETPVAMVTPSLDVVKSYVQIYSPLPASVGVHPAACDYASYIRYRDKNGPANSNQAASVMFMMPGTAGGADEFEPNALNTIEASAARGRHTEYWVYSFRSDCLNDRTGLNAAIQAKDYHVALNYYYFHKPVNGKVFAGWPTWRDESFLGSIGIAQTMNDWRTIITDAFPDAAQRSQKVFCGGHSLGGFTIGALTAWDYDGNPDTTDDAGYNLCAGWVALDSIVTNDTAGIGKTPIISDISNGVLGIVPGFFELLGRLGIHPSIDLKVVMTAQTWNIHAIAAMAAYYQPNAESTLLREFPVGVNIDLTFRAFLATTWTQFVTNVPDVRSFRYTNEALLGSMWDNNTGPLALGHVGIGSLAGGPLGLKTFLFPTIFNDFPVIGPFIQASVAGQEKVGPLDPRALYTWHNYNEPAQRRWDGKVVSDPAREVTDIRQFETTLFSGPTSYLDAYFSTKQLIDHAFIAGVRTGDLSHVQHLDGANLRPLLAVLTGDGPFNPTVHLLNPIAAFLNPSGPPVMPPGTIYAPGYHHQDAMAGAKIQNSGQPETVSTAFTSFMFDHTT
jgi:hypothetical protein